MASITSHATPSEDGPCFRREYSGNVNRGSVKTFPTSFGTGISCLRYAPTVFPRLPHDIAVLWCVRLPVSASLGHYRRGLHFRCLLLKTPPLLHRMPIAIFN
ncbi:hypothetical protein FOMPIDRAFT_160903 [Fomitopsis schrenkii]|uniref:Uncharacterized protein n=1 Tax=Fomitopsis schrenkii TaxID=2126942 RepID=S8F817_FOMSC|nr:hypothetical protein FOMPIDRAFT_160903 [Fomitopsis schrenkii]